MIHAVYGIVFVVSIIILAIIFKSKRSREVWYNVVSDTDTHRFVLEGYEDDVKCFLFKISKNGKEWALLKDFPNKDTADKFFNKGLGEYLDDLSESEMNENVPPPRILDLPRK